MKKSKILTLFIAASIGAASFAGCFGGDGDEKGHGPDDHVYGGDWVLSEEGAPTYTSGGFISQYCTADDGGYQQQVVPALNDTRYQVTEIDETNGEATYTITIEGTTFSFRAPYVKGDTSTPLPANNKIWLVGDSTVCAFTSDTGYYMPRYGYGTQIASYFNVLPNQVENYARSGRSAYSYKATESIADYNALFSSNGGMKSGDYLFIGFGHNDEKTEIARYADPTLAYDDDSTYICDTNVNRPVSFKYILNQYYIQPALNAGATPILCTPISRLFEDKDASKYDTDHITSDKFDEGGVMTYKGGDYAEAIRELGEELGITVIDMLDMTQSEYKEIGYAEASKYHAATGAQWVDKDTKTDMVATGIDGTHTNLLGAKNNAYYLATAVANANIGLSANVKTNITKPTYEEYGADCINSSYTIPDQEPFNPTTDASKIWTGINGTITDDTTGDSYKWYGTVFGSGASAGNFSITQGGSANDGFTFTITAAASKGKIESGQDVLAAVFIQLPLETAFKMTATANATVGEKQSGYGIMLRDDIYIDDFSSTVSSNYINAGCYTSDGSSNILYWRMNTKLGAANTGVSGFECVSGTHNLELTRLSQNATLKFDDYSRVMSEDDYNVAVSDNEYVYLCLWGTRGITVTFSNITFSTLEWQQA